MPGRNTWGTHNPVLTLGRAAKSCRSTWFLRPSENHLYVQRHLVLGSLKSQPHLTDQLFNSLTIKVKVFRPNVGWVYLRAHLLRSQVFLIDPLLEPYRYERWMCFARPKPLLVNIALAAVVASNKSVPDLLQPRSSAMLLAPIKAAPAQTSAQKSDFPEDNETTC